MRALFEIPLPEKKKITQVKQPEDDSSWACGDIGKDLKAMVKASGDDTRNLLFEDYLF